MTSRVPPGPRGWPVLGVLPRIWRDPLRFFSEVALECGPLARVGLGRFTLFLLSDPALIEGVLLDREDRYWKGAGLAVADAVLGRGLATSDGDDWRRARRIQQPAFTPDAVLRLGPAIDASIDETLDGWREGERDLTADAARLTQRALARTLFGDDVSTDAAQPLIDAVAVAAEHIDYCAWAALRAPDSWPTPRNLRFKRALRVIDAEVTRLIDAGGPAGSLLARLLASSDAGDQLPRELVRDELVTSLFAGQETTTHALGWAFWLLGQHPEWQDALADDATRRRIVDESLRLYPPGWVLVRTPREPVELGGFPMDAGAPILISPYVVQRHPDHWDAPTAFDPDRWLPERSEGRHRFAYFPFGGGRRTCIGIHLAYAVLERSLARAAERWRWTTSGPDVRPRPLTTLAPRPGVRLTLQRRVGP